MIKGTLGQTPVVEDSMTRDKNTRSSLPLSVPTTTADARYI